jgi:hypothetical protein
MKKTIIALFLILSTSNVLAQSFDEDLQRRYFLSRNRLKKWCRSSEFRRHQS